MRRSLIKHKAEVVCDLFHSLRSVFTSSKMKLFVLAVLVLVADSFDVKEEWKQFKLDYERTYKSLREEKIRFAIFQDNLQKIQEHNKKYDKGEVTYAMKITQFTDMTHQEFLDLLKPLSDHIPSTGGEKFVPKGTEIPKSKDWRKEGAVTPVKNQRHCGSCWAFSATGAIEGQLFRKNGSLISLSEQNLIDCDRDMGINGGCDGGYPDLAFRYVRANGIATAADYPYKACNDKCNPQGHATVKITDYVGIDANEDHIVEALATVGPIAVLIHGSTLGHYSHGIIDEHSGCNGELDHAVLLVGFGEENGMKYYIVKNSWGDKWGEAGYFRLQRNVGACSVQKVASYPKM